MKTNQFSIRWSKLWTFISVSVVVVALLLHSTLTFADSANSFVFDDLKSHWSKSDVMALYEKGIVNGTSATMFAPNRQIRVDEFIKLCVTALGHKIDTSGYTNWATPYIKKALDIGIVYESDFKNFSRAITREEMAALASRTLSFTTDVSSSSIDFDVIKSMADYSIATDYYKQDVINAVRLGLMKGQYTTPAGNYFKPKAYSTRAEAAVVISRVLDGGRRVAFVPKDDNGNVPYTKVSYYTFTDKDGWTTIPTIVYAPLNALGRYETEVTDIWNEWDYKPDEINGYFERGYQEQQKELNVLGVISKEEYEKPHNLEYMHFSFSANLRAFGDTKNIIDYDLFISTRNSKTLKPNQYYDYYLKHYPKLMYYTLDKLFGAEADRVRGYIKHGFINQLPVDVEGKVLTINNRSFWIVADKDGMRVNISEKLK